MKKPTEPIMDYCEVFDTEEEAIAACREVNRGLNKQILDVSRLTAIVALYSVGSETVR